VAELVALALPGGPTFVEQLRRAWDDGDAVFPVDLRLPPGPRTEALEAAAPTILVEPDGTRHRVASGRAVEDGTAVVVTTSGTTGSPRAVLLDHAAVAASAEATSRRLAVDPSRDHWLACLPLAHVGGLSVVLRALHTGTPLTVLAGFEVDAVRDARRAGATLVSLVPTALRRMDTSGFRVVVLGAAPPPADRPANTVSTYGMTETGSGCVYDGVPLDGVEVEIAEPSGEILLRGPMVARAYRDGSPVVDADGWLHTGDGGRLGARGALEVHGRLGDVVNTGGEKVWPTPVEAVLRRHLGVRDAVVVGLPDPEWGQRVVAAIVAADPSAPPDPAELAALVRAEMAPWAVPKEFHFLPALPTTSLGKVKRQELAALLTAAGSASNPPARRSERRQPARELL